MLRPIQETSSLMEYLKAYKDTRSNFHRAKLATLENFNVHKLLMPNVLPVGSPAI